MSKAMRFLLYVDDIERAVEFYTECSEAILSYVADKMNVSAHGLTSDNLADLLMEKGADNQLVQDTVRFLNRCGFARYASSEVNPDDIKIALEEAESLMVRFEGIKF